MRQLNSYQMGKFEKITIQVDVKFSSFDMALENWQTAQMPPGKSPKIISLGITEILGIYKLCIYIALLKIFTE